MSNAKLKIENGFTIYVTDDRQEILPEALGAKMKS